MRQHLFFHHGWFLQNLEKGCVRTNMHTTVPLTNFFDNFFDDFFLMNFFDEFFDEFF